MGLRSIKEIFVVGHGPSSSHTMGPYFATQYIINKYKEKGIVSVSVTLYGSLALTGFGHLTDKIIELGLKDYKHDIEFDFTTERDHPNTMLFRIKTKEKTYREIIVSIGGGTIVTKDNIKSFKEKNTIYPHRYMKDILKYCKENDLSLYDYVAKFENPDIQEYFENVLRVMDEAVERGLLAEGYLPGSLKVKRKAHEMYNNMIKTDYGLNDVTMNVAVHSFAVAEENAAGGVIVTAPTCGSAGVIPGCIQYLRMKGVSDFNIVRGLMVAGLFGIVCKTNASVSGAEAGCQAEIGVACSMGAAMISFCFGKPIEDTIQAAEIALEHSLGLTCDPVEGYVQIPCIERCSLYAMKAINAVKLSIVIPNDDIRVSFDVSVETMMKTGIDMDKRYKETSLGGLAEMLKEDKD